MSFLTRHLLPPNQAQGVCLLLVHTYLVGMTAVYHLGKWPSLNQD